MTKPDYDRLVRLLAERYSAGSDGYAGYWRHMLDAMGTHLLDLLPLDDADRILDLGCGPGTLLSAVRQRAELAFIAGIDISPGMLRKSISFPGLSLALMDARRMAFSEGSFDTLIVAFMLFHFPDRVAGLKETWRVLRPGGTIGTATFHTAPSFKAKRVWEKMLDGMTLLGSSHLEDLSSIDDYSATDRPEKVALMLQEAGFDRVQTTLKDFEYQWEPGEYLAVRSQFGRSGVRFRSLPGEDQRRLLQDMHSRFTNLSSDAFKFTPTVLYAVARRPS